MRRRYHFHFTTLAYIGLAALVGVAAANRPNNLLVWVFGLMLAAVLLSGVISGLMLMGLRVVRLDPRRARVGEPMVVRYSLSNSNRMMPAFGLRIEETSDARTRKKGASPFVATARAGTASAWVLHVGAGEVVHGEAVLWPTRRGRLKLQQIRLSSGFPFGLLRKSITVDQEQEFLVHPRTVELRPNVLQWVRGRGSEGVRASARVGAGEEYYGVRDYRIGDSMRQISWRRSATMDKPISIERTAPSPPRLRVVLDLRTPTTELRVPAGVDARQAEEDAISLAGSVLRLGERHGYEVALTVLGTTPMEASPLRGGHWHTERLMATLAGLDLDDTRTDQVPLMADAERAGMVFVAPDRVDPTAIGSAATGALMLTARHLHDLAVDARRSPLRSATESVGAATDLPVGSRT